MPALAGNFLAGLHWKRHRAASCSFKMISFSNINKQYGKQLLFVDASFQLNPGEKVGLVGPNAVSYTHLDVYKRQILRGGPGAFGKRSMTGSRIFCHSSRSLFT